MTMEVLIAAVMLFSACAVEDPGSVLTGEPMALWQGEAPGELLQGEARAPMLYKYLPPADRATGAAVVVCPGGGYGGLASNHEGEQVAQFYLEHGIAAFVLLYRHAPQYRHPVPLMDAQRAVRTVRANAAKWGVDPARIGMMGFSAGGHLTATAGTQFAPGNPTAEDPAERESSRPDFLVLVYPVITFEPPYAHTGSRDNLLGKDASPELVSKMCAQNNVTSETPPTFLVHASTDDGVPPQNSVLFYLALRAAGAPAEMHLFANGPHGFGLGQKDPALAHWPDLLLEWLRTMKMTEKA